MSKTISGVAALALGITLLVAAPAEAATRYSVSVAPSASRADVGRSIVLRGAVSPNAKGQRVLVQRRVGTSWVTVARPLLNRKSRYAATVRVPAPGTNLFRVFKKRSNGHPAGVSRTVAITGWRWRNLVSMPVWNPPGAPSQQFTVQASGMLGPVAYALFLKQFSAVDTTSRVTYLLENKCTRFDAHVALMADSVGDSASAYLSYYDANAVGPTLISQVTLVGADPVHVIRTSDVVSKIGALTLQLQFNALGRNVGWGAAKVYCRS